VDTELEPDVQISEACWRRKDDEKRKETRAEKRKETGMWIWKSLEIEERKGSQGAN
jgi:hypothetical protein